MYIYICIYVYIRAFLGSGKHRAEPEVLQQRCAQFAEALAQSPGTGPGLAAQPRGGERWPGQPKVGLEKRAFIEGVVRGYCQNSGLMTQAMASETSELSIIVVVEWRVSEGLLWLYWEPTPSPLSPGDVL